MSPHVPVEHLLQGRGRVRRLQDAFGHREPLCLQNLRRGWTACGQQRAQQVPRRFGRAQHVLRRADAERALEAHQQLHARQAVQAQVFLQRAVQRHRAHVLATGVEFGQDVPHDPQYSLVRHCARRRVHVHRLHRCYILSALSGAGWMPILAD